MSIEDQIAEAERFQKWDRAQQLREQMAREQEEGRINPQGATQGLYEGEAAPTTINEGADVESAPEAAEPPAEPEEPASASDDAQEE